MKRKQIWLMAGGAVAGLASTIAMSPVSALLPETSGSLGVAAGAKSVAAKAAAAKAPTPRKKASKLVSTSAPIAGGRFGTVKLTVKVSGGIIKKIDYASTVLRDNRSLEIAQYAVPRLASEALNSKSASVSNISGATYTSQAFQNALQAALTKAKK